MLQSVPVAGVVTIDFETFPDSTPIADSTSITTQFPGLTFTNTTVITAGVSLNEFELPPYSGVNVAFDDGGPISISFDTPVLSFGGYFTYYEPLTLAAFDISNNEVATATSAFSINVACDPGPVCLGDPGSSPNEFLSVAFAGGISAVTITGDPGGGSFVMDDITYTTAAATTAPEPDSLLLILSAMAFILLVWHGKPHTTMTKIRGGLLVTFLLLLAFSLVGAVWLLGQPIPRSQPTQQLHSRVAPASSSAAPTPQSTTVSAHSLGVVTLAPPSIAAGSSQPVVITVQITDPALIAGSVNLVQVLPTGQALVIGQLNDNGTNGDLIPNDSVYSIAQPFTSLAVGTATLRISAAFSGSLARVQSPNLSLVVSQPAPTSTWATLTDSGKLFSISVPALWGLTTSEVANSDPDTVDSVVFSFPNGATAFVITEHTPSGWVDLQTNGFTTPDELGQSGTYTFGWNPPPDIISVPGLTDSQIRSQYDTIRSTFQTH